MNIFLSVLFIAFSKSKAANGNKYTNQGGGKVPFNPYVFPKNANIKYVAIKVIAANRKLSLTNKMQMKIKKTFRVNSIAFINPCDCNKAPNNTIDKRSESRKS